MGHTAVHNLVGWLTGLHSMISISYFLRRAAAQCTDCCEIAAIGGNSAHNKLVAQPSSFFLFHYADTQSIQYLTTDGGRPNPSQTTKTEQRSFDKVGKT